jgi:hypothetical protein
MTAEEWDACDDLHQLRSFLQRLLEANPARNRWLDRKCRLYALACLTPYQSEFRTTGTRYAFAFLQKYADTKVVGVKGVARVRAWLQTEFRSLSSEGLTPEPLLHGTLLMALMPWPIWSLYAGCNIVGVRWLKRPDPDPTDVFSVDPVSVALLNEYVALLREVFGNPFRPVNVPDTWRTSDVRTVALATYQSPDPATGQLDLARLAVLADALEEAGCDDATLLAHLRSPGPHVPGCWVVDAILGKELRPQ